MPKTVSFHTEPAIFSIPPSEERGMDSEFHRKSDKRGELEKMIHHKVDKELKYVKSIMQSWRDYDVNVVFGNLGRQPYLLDYFLDLCFSHEETIQVHCDFDIPSNYNVSYAKHIDFLIIIEPFFGYSVQKSPHVEHIIVLCSHMSLNLPKRTKFRFLHLSSFKHQSVPEPEIKNAIHFKPPMFHLNQICLQNEAICLDVTKSETAHEAYLRILTGREVCGKNRVMILINQRDQEILRDHLAKIQSLVKEEDWVGNIYWDFLSRTTVVSTT
jgi:hypothetical protein